MKRLMLATALGIAMFAGPAMAQYGAGDGGMQTGVVETPQSDDDAQIGVDDGSGIIQGKTELDHKKKKKKKDPNCHWVDHKGYRTKDCW